MTLLPPNASKPEQVLEKTMARLSDVPVPNASIWNPDTIPVHLLPWLAWALSVDIWDPDWPEAIKRRVVKSSFAVHRTKGTLGALETALAALGFETEVREWFDETPVADSSARNKQAAPSARVETGRPYTFSVTALANRNIGQGVVLDEVGQASIIRTVEAAKNVRSHYDFTIGATWKSGVALALSSQPAQQTNTKVTETASRSAGGDWGMTVAQIQAQRLKAFLRGANA